MATPYDLDWDDELCACGSKLDAEPNGDASEAGFCSDHCWLEDLGRRLAFTMREGFVPQFMLRGDSELKPVPFWSNAAGGAVVFVELRQDEEIVQDCADGRMISQRPDGAGRVLALGWHGHSVVTRLRLTLDRGRRDHHGWQNRQLFGPDARKYVGPGGPLVASCFDDGGQLLVAVSGSADGHNEDRFAQLLVCSLFRRGVRLGHAVRPWRWESGVAPMSSDPEPFCFMPAATVETVVI